MIKELDKLIFHSPFKEQLFIIERLEVFRGITANTMASTLQTTIRTYIEMKTKGSGKVFYITSRLWQRHFDLIGKIEVPSKRDKNIMLKKQKKDSYIAYDLIKELFNIEETNNNIRDSIFIYKYWLELH